MNHPWLLSERAEDIATFCLSSEQACVVRDAMLDYAAAHQEERITRAGLAATIAARGLETARKRLDVLAAVHPEFPVSPKSSPSDVHQWWIYIITLEAQLRPLHQELRDAEYALGNAGTTVASTRALEHLVAVKKRIESVEMAYVSQSRKHI